MSQTLPTEPIGSIPRPKELIELFKPFEEGKISIEELKIAEDRAVIDTIRELEKTGSPVITDGEQRKPSFMSYPLKGINYIDPNLYSCPICSKPTKNDSKFRIDFQDGHTRWMPVLTDGPFEYGQKASEFVKFLKTNTNRKVKQAIISPSALSTVYPSESIKGYSYDHFLVDLISKTENEIRDCLASGADSVQIDFTEARYAIKIDPTLGLLKKFIEINNLVLERFTSQERKKLGIHTCPGGDMDTTHSKDVPYSLLLPFLFELKAGNFFIQMASETDPDKGLELIQKFLKKDQVAYIGVIDVLSPKIETPEVVTERILSAAKYIPLEQLGTTDDCGYAPFADDEGTPRLTAFQKIKARVEGTEEASRKLGI